MTRTKLFADDTNVTLSDMNSEKVQNKEITEL